MNSSGKPASKRRVILVLVVLLIVAAVLAASFSGRPGDLRDQIVWLTPSEFAQIKRVGPLTPLKFQLMRWTAPLWNSYLRNKPQLTISASVVTLPVEMRWPTNSFSPFVTATNRTRAWILSPEQLKSIQTELSALPDTAVALRSQVIVASGLAAQVSTGNTLGSGSNSVFYGSAVFLISDVLNDKVVLTFELNHSQLAPNLKPGELTVQTNQAYACRAAFPNNGGLLVENPYSEPGASNRHWLFLTAKAVDASGRLIGR
jgi:hypothetical protein